MTLEDLNFKETPEEYIKDSQPIFSEQTLNINGFEGFQQQPKDQVVQQEWPRYSKAIRFINS